jgi:hypothetical protein
MTSIANAASVSSSPVAGSHAITYCRPACGGVQISHGPSSETFTAVGTSIVPRRVLRLTWRRARASRLRAIWACASRIAF